MHVQSELLKQIAGLRHGFGTRSETVPASLEPYWQKSHPSWKQVHGIHSVEVTESHQKCGETDALFTFEKGMPVAVVTADCVPVLLARKNGGAGAAIHAGWRGTFAGAVDTVLKELVNRGEKLSGWVAAIGPAIGPCCYEVSEELISDFARKFSHIDPKILSPSFRKLDLPAIHDYRLKKAGLGEVDLIRACTQCSGGAVSPTFHSYRRGDKNSRQYSGLVFEI